MPTTATDTFLGTGLIPFFAPETAREQNVKISASKTLKLGDILAELVGNNEVQTITISATGGTFTVTYAGQTTTAIAFDATAATFLAALEALSTIGEENIAVTLASSVYTVTFQNKLGLQNIAAMTTTATGLTGGAGTATVATSTAGSSGTRGEFDTYDPDATNGLEIPKAICKYDLTTNASKVVTINEKTQLAAPVYTSGYFSTKDLRWLDANAITKMGGRLISGSIADGVFSFGV